MAEERRKNRRFSVSWPGRAMLADRSMHVIKINDVSIGGIGVEFPQMLAVRTQVNVEFFVRAKNFQAKLRAKTRVAFNSLLSDNRGAKLGLQFQMMSAQDMQILQDVLAILDAVQQGLSPHMPSTNEAADHASVEPNPNDESQTPPE